MEIKKVLVIDDEPDLCQLLKNILESTGMYQVSLASGGLEGIEKCKKENPDLIFLDYVMPNVKGDVVIECLRGYGEMKNIPIILMSGLGEMIFFDRIDLEKWIHKYPDGDSTRRPPPDEELEEIANYIAEKMGVAYYLPKPFSTKILLAVTIRILSGDFKRKTEMDIPK